MKKYAVSMLILGSLIMGGCGDSQEEQSSQGEQPLIVNHGTIPIGGTLSGLTDPYNYGDPLSLEISLVAADGVETLKLTENDNGGFIFKDKLIEGETYTVVIKRQPWAGQLCTLINEAGEANGANITNIIVQCI